ncbi:MAG: hypothetical protein IPL61_38985 [Myxococcales bacterium]|nr:hypothetical protein [Myxococcales bacterium]
MSRAARVRAIAPAAVVVLAIVAGCSRDRSPRPRVRAVGTIVVDGIALDDPRGWTAEVDRVRSSAGLGALGGAVPLADLERGLTVTRRPHTRIIEVSVALADELASRRACDATVQAYLSARLRPDPSDPVTLLRAELERQRATLVEDDPAQVAAYQRTLERLRTVDLASGEPIAVRVLDPCALAPR